MGDIAGRKCWVAELLLVCVAAGWGIGFPVMKLAVEVHPVLMVLGLRFGFSALLLLPFNGAKLRTVPCKTLAAGVGLGSLLGVAFIFLIFGLQATTASNTGFLAGLSVIWVLFLSGPLEGRLPSFNAVLATLFGVAGLYLMSDIDGWKLQRGDFLVVIGSVFTALHIFALNKLTAHHDNATLTFLQITTMGAIMMLIQHFMGGEVLPTVWDNKLIVTLLVTAVFSTVMTFWVQTHYQRYTTPTRAVLIYNLEPVFATLFAAWLLDESFSAAVLLGGGLILFGMCLPGIFAALISTKRNHRIGNTRDGPSTQRQASTALPK